MEMPAMSSLTKLNNTEIYTFLKTVTPFKFLEDELLHKIALDTKVATFSEGSCIFREGEQSKKTLFLVYEGQARAVVKAGGKETVTAVRNKGDFFGVTVMLSDEPYPVSMIVSNNLTCLLISQESFQAALGSSDKFADYFTKALASRLKELYLAFSGDRSGPGLIDSHTLRQRVSEIYAGNVVTCYPMDQIRDVARKMSKANVSSVVVIAFNGKPVGIITEKDLVGKVLSADKPDLELQAHEIMTTGLITVRPDDFSYKALLLMTKHSIKHIIVTDEHDVLHGIFTVKDLLRSRKSGTLSIVNQIEYQENFTGLARLIGEIDQVQQALLAERAYATEICALVSELYDRVTRKIVQIAEKEMASDGWETLTTAYCFINMGSAGRKEQFFRTDQDNGIIYEDPPEESAESTSSYFLAFGNKIVDGLEECGFARCKGGIMAGNQQWCLPLSTWKNNINEWAEKLDPKDIRDMTIFLDNRFIAGKEILYEQLKDFTTRLFQNSIHTHVFLAEDDLKHRVPLNMFKQIITKKTGDQGKKLNLKSTVAVHLVDCIRIFALREGIKETNTFERIRLLKKRGVFNPEDAEYFESAHESLLMFRIQDAVSKLKLGLPFDNNIDLDNLGKKDQAVLKESLLIVNRLQSLTAHAFHVHRTK